MVNKMNTIFEYLMGSVLLSLFFIYSGKKNFGVRWKLNLKTLLVIFAMVIIITVNYMYLDNIAKTSVAYLTILISYRILFDRPIIQCVIAAVVPCILMAIGEVSFIAIISVLNLLGISVGVMELIGGFFANLIIVLLSLLMLMIVYKRISKLLSKVGEYNKLTLIITFILLVTINCTLFYKLYFHKYQVDNYLLFNAFLILSLSYIAFVLIKQQYDKIKISDEYGKYVEYSKQSEKLVDQYSINQHENKNELIIIKSMVHKNNKELLEYLDEIISSKDNIDDAWIRSLRYLPFGGLKGIIHNKVSEMKDKYINVFLNISKSVENSKLKNLSIKDNNQLSKILGVFLDNAMEAAILSEDKEISICVFLEDNEVVFEISNTYITDIDISRIYEMGHTSKGRGRGYGLSLVNAVIKENKIFTNEVKKIDKYFVQILKIKM